MVINNLLTKAFAKHYPVEFNNELSYVVVISNFL